MSLDAAIRSIGRKNIELLLDDGDDKQPGGYRLLPRAMRRRLARKFHGRGFNRRSNVKGVSVKAIWSTQELDALQSELEREAKRRGMILTSEKEVR